MADGFGAPGLLAELRQVASLSQEELAARSGISSRAISKIEQGRITRPHMHTLDSLAVALNLSAEDHDRLVVAFRPGRPAGPAAASADPRLQLPPRAATVVGRDQDLDTLHVALTSQHLEGGVIVISGLGGIGKTTVALEAAARASKFFPDGIVTVSLTRPNGAELTTVELLGELIRLVAPEVSRLPPSENERTSLWRSLSTVQRLLVILDDAATEAQIRASQFSGPGRLLVTSRAPLGGLDTALRIRLGLLDATAAAQLLPLASDPAEQVAIDQLIDACAGLPLALKLLRARLQLSPHLSLTAMTERIGVTEQRLDGLVAGDRSVAASIESSARLLPVEDRALLAGLAQLDLPLFADWHVAAGGNRSLLEATVLCDHFVATGLVDPVVVGGVVRYRIHQLVRMHLRPGPDHGATMLAAIVGWAVHLIAATARGGAARTTPHSLWPARPASLGRGVAARLTRDPEWLDRELPSMVALADSAARRGQAVLAGAMLAGLRPVLTRTGRLSELIALAQRCAGLAPSESLATACAELTIASAEAELGEFASAQQRLELTLPQLSEVDAVTLAGAWYELGWVRAHTGDVTGAVDAYGQALQLNRSSDNRYGELGAHVALAELLHQQRPDDPGAFDHARAAHKLAAHITDYRAMVKMHLSLAAVQAEHDGERQVSTLRWARQIATEHHDDPLIARCDLMIAAAALADGDTSAALKAAKSSLRLARKLGRDADMAEALSLIDSCRPAHVV